MKYSVVMVGKIDDETLCFITLINRNYLFFISGPQVGLEDEADRKRKLLSQYGFVCKCRACTSDDWKLTEKMRHVLKFSMFLTGNSCQISVFEPFSRPMLVPSVRVFRK